MKARLALLLLAVTSVAAEAAIYQWKDEKGRIHFGEEVPAKYQKSAREVGPGPVNTMPAQKVPAQQKAAPPEEESAPPASAVPAAAAAKSADEICREQLARYQRAQECFGRYTNTNGSVRIEAFQECDNVTQPVGCNPVTDGNERTSTP